MNDFPFRIYRIFYGAWRRRYVILVPIFLLPFIGLFVAMTSAKHYKAHTSMLIQETSKMNPFLEDFAVSAMLKERVGALKTLLHSRHILHEVAKELNYIDETSSAAKRDMIIAQLSASLKMQMVGKDLIRIDHTANSPDNMEAFLNSVSKHFVEQLLAPERSSIEDSASFLNEHLQAQREQLNKAELALANFKARHAEALPELHTMNITRLNKLKQKLAERKAQMAGAIKNVGGLNRLLSTTNPVIGRLEEQIVKIRGELALMRARYTDKHSAVQALKRTLRRLESERETVLNNSEQIVSTDQLWDMASLAVRNIKSDQQPILISQLENLQNAKSKADSLDEEIASLESMIATIEQGIKTFGEKESELIRLERDLKVKRELYENLLKRYEMAQVTGSLGRFEQSKRVKIIDRPFTPSVPANLPAIMFIIAGLVGGIFFGIGFAIFLELTDTTIRYRATLEEVTQAPVISRIPPITN